MRPSSGVCQQLASFVILLFTFLPIISVSQNTDDTPRATLDYGTFVGASSATYNITYFRKIPFAASTAGRNRFRAPQPPVPLPSNVPYNTDQDMDMCPQRTVNGTEDCLQLGVYSRPWSDSQRLRPVLLSFYGGGFIRGSAAFKVPPYGFPLLNASIQNDYVVVYSNYRTNVFGFLPGSKIRQHPDTDLNPGLLDQQAALKWIQKYIHHFGGDNRNVTIQGQSAGGGSVLAQAIATGNRGKNLFVKATSTSPYWPKTYKWNSKESEIIYEQTLKDVGCSGQRDEIECLKNVDVQKLRDSALTLSTSQQLTTQRFTFAPVIDEKFLTEPLSKVIRKGKLNAEFVQTSYNQHEGEDFIPLGFLNQTTGTDGFNSSAASFDKYLAGFLPDFNRKQLDEVRRLYPQQGSSETLAWNTTYVRAGMMYRDLVLACPAYWFSGMAKQGYLIEYTISPAKHASDVAYWNDINVIQKSDPLTYQAYTGAMASFIQTGNPNTHKLTDATTPAVPRISKSKQFVVSKDGPKVTGIDLLEERCDFWLRNSDKVPI